MRRLRSLALLATTIATSAALFVPSSSSAEDQIVLDPARDYWHDHRADGGTPDQHRPDYGKPDLRRTAYRHWHDRASVRFKMARLERPDHGYWRVTVQLRTNEGLRRTASMFVDFDGRHTTIDWSGSGNCAIDHQIDYAGDAFVLDVPRTCLSAPTWIRFRSATRWWPTSDDVPYLDVTGSTGYRLKEWSAPIARG